MLRQGKISRAVGSYFASNPEVGVASERCELEVEVVPQGTLVESLRAAGAATSGKSTEPWLYRIGAEAV